MCSVFGHHLENLGETVITKKRIRYTLKNIKIVLEIFTPIYIYLKNTNKNNMNKTVGEREVDTDKNKSEKVT